jgi:2-amino-4-hydroxy-6-hydroxymethyldihydropteridine diphosphokinase
MILVAMGSNLPRPDGAQPLETCREALRALAELPGYRLAEVSRWYETTPVPPSGQPNYINLVARLVHRPGLAGSPEALLAALQSIEFRFDRRRGEPNAARTLDLDLIAMDEWVRDESDPILPHPRAHLRAFVLLPLLDIAPNWVHPRNGQTARAMLEAVDRTGVRAL